jgi:acetylornithine deacetylase
VITEGGRIVDGLTELERQVVQRIEKDKEEILGFLKKLISFPSVTGDENALQAFLIGVLSDAGLVTDVFEIDTEELSKEPLYMPPPLSYEGRPNVVAIQRGSGGGRSLLFNGHVDVIGADKDAWKYDPWASEIKDGLLYGRGASDMKSGLAAMTMAILTLCSMKIKLRGDVILQYVVDEEYNGNGTLSCCARGHTADAAISCEASDLEIQPASTGSMWFEIEVEGRGASMSRRWEGVDAIEKACLICKAINSFEQIRIQEAKHPMYPDVRGPVACFVGTMNAGTFASAPPSVAKITGRMGILPGEDHLIAQQSFKDYIRAFCELDPWLKNHQPNVVFKGMMALPAETPPDSEIVKSMAGTYSAVMGEEPLVTGHHGGADTRILVNRFKMPSVMFGPGMISQMHADNENMRVDDLIPATKVLAVTIMRWCGVIE